MIKFFFFVLVTITIIFSCKNITEKKEKPIITKTHLKQKIKASNNSLIEAAKAKNFGKAIDIYMDDALLLAEYNPLIDGKEDIKTYYTEIFERQNITGYLKETIEIFDFGETILEIGTFQKSFSNEKNQEGKYFNVWKHFENGNLRLKAESFGFYHPIDNPATLRVQSLKDRTPGLVARNRKVLPLELDAYDARNENIVRDRDTDKVIQSYTTDGIYYPFASPNKSGIKNLSKHYTDYHRNPVKIDSIEVWTYDYELVNDGIIKYSKFYVDWVVPDFSGTTRGTGIIYYKREEDNSLKIHRQIGLHIHDE